MKGRGGEPPPGETPEALPGRPWWSCCLSLEIFEENGDTLNPLVFH